MKKDNKESINLRENANLNTWEGTISNPIPAWLNGYFKSYYRLLPDINETLIEGYPIDDDF